MDRRFEPARCRRLPPSGRAEAVAMGAPAGRLRRRLRGAGLAHPSPRAAGRRVGHGRGDSHEAYAAGSRPPAPVLFGRQPPLFADHRLLRSARGRGPGADLPVASRGSPGHGSAAERGGRRSGRGRLGVGCAHSLARRLRAPAEGRHARRWFPLAAIAGRLRDPLRRSLRPAAGGSVRAVRERRPVGRLRERLEPPGRCSPTSRAWLGSSWRRRPSIPCSMRVGRSPPGPTKCAAPHDLGVRPGLVHGTLSTARAPDPALLAIERLGCPLDSLLEEDPP